MRTEMENPELPGQSIWVAPEAVPVHMASGWSPVDAEVSERREQERTEQRVADAEAQVARSEQARADAQTDAVRTESEQAQADAVKDAAPAPADEPRASRRVRTPSGPSPTPQGTDSTGTENQE